MLPPIDDLLATVRVVALPLRTRFRGLDVREAALLEGPLGWTEFSPFVEYDDVESAAWLEAAIDFGWTAPPAPLRDHVLVNATIPAVDAGRVAEVLARFPGCRTAKVKVAERGTVLADDVARVAEVRRLLGPEGRVRIDANAAWTVDEAEHAIHALAEHDLEYVEQPCASVEEMAELRGRIRHLGVPVAADESVRKAEDPLRVARAGAADLLVVKAQPLGGIHRALGITREAGLPVVVSSALDTSVGISMAAHLAAAIPELPHDCGLGTVSLFVEDVTADPLVPVDGRIPVRRVTPDARLLDAHAVDAERRAWWTDRIRRTHAVLAARG
ncbi:o-succinylbenzoate synthase [Clavibacter sp. MX14-G9D]|uniref:o-succinylbenzoate synthase n=1 Tax=Clavibacter sp. MX14-G9D TaxID=3064656 RepID=UPI00293E2BCF|nr:o-succinylbenzoate synthase [Clavibacter sp. MX14-G9D]